MSTDGNDADFEMLHSLTKNIVTIDFLNSHFSHHLNSLASASRLHSKLLNETVNLENQLSVARKEVPNQIEDALQRAEKAKNRITELGVKQEMLRHEMMDFIRNSEPEMKKLSAIAEKVKELGQYRMYLSHLIVIENLSSDIQTALLTESLSSSVDSFQCLTDVYVELHSSSCHKLLHFLADTITFWYNILQDKVASEFEATLEAVGWPVVSTTIKPANTSTNTATSHETLHRLFNQLLKLQLPNDLIVNTDTAQSQPITDTGQQGAILPLELMVKPLCKRFKYHFYGHKLTNDVEKPEWYFTQVLTWMRDHREFLDTHIQPLVTVSSKVCLDVKVEFMHCLMKLVIEKMVVDLPELLKNEVAFAHLIDEALSFDLDLRSNYGYPMYFPGCLHVLCLPDAFDKWKNIEKKFAVEKIDSVLTSREAWTSQFKDIAGIDNLHVPQCADLFISLIHTISDRYQSLPDPQCRMDFLDLQLDLLDDFRIRLVQIMKTEIHDSLGLCYTAILNTVHYIGEVLAEWNERVFFVQLQYERSRQDDSCITALESPPSSCGPDPTLSPASNLTDYLSFTELDSSPSKSSGRELRSSVEGAVFDEVIELLRAMEGDMVHTVTHSVLADVKARSKPYRKQRWISLQSQKEPHSLGLSPTACEMLLVLRDHLQIVDSLLSPPLFTRFWQQLAADLDTFIYHEVILCNKFNEGGAAQLTFDVTRNLMPLFAQFTQKPDAYFRSTSEACRILTLNVGSAILLKEVLYNCLHTPADKQNCTMPSDSSAALHDLSIFTLTGEDTETVLSLRTNLCL